MLKRAVKSVINQFVALSGPQRWPGIEPRIWVLMYHRILPHAEAEKQHEEPGMYVSPATFEKHITWMLDYMTPVALSDWVYRVSQSKPLPQRSVAITFDDGWRDNYTHAYPILKKHNIPFTIFAVSGMIGSTKSFWPNQLSQLLSNQESNSDWPAGLEWLAEISSLKPGEVRTTEDISQVIQDCKQLSDRDIYRYLERAHAEEAENRESRTMLDWGELLEMQNSELLEVGCHTENHVRLLETLPKETIETEILNGKLLLEEKLNREVGLFCYPNGDISKKAHNVVVDNYQAAVTTQKGINNTTQNKFYLKRIGMHEDVSNSRTSFLARLSGWL